MEDQQKPRDYSTISPSAKSLLYLKGHTNIPYAREAAEQMMLPEKYEPDFNRPDFGFWGRTVHFENRYWSIDQLLSDLEIKNILELSSGFSFRGLALVEREEGLHYIDTDLPEVIETKTAFAKAIRSAEPKPQSKLEMLPLNALDDQAFQETIDRFPAGPVVIVNEGLLMYLGVPEKEKLCGIIHHILKERGGYWITADIYIKRQMDKRLQIDDRLSDFFKQHNIEANMFDSMDQAKAFFEEQGFVIDKEAVPDRSKLKSVEYLLKNTSEEQLKTMQEVGRVHTTWRLKVAGAQ